MLHIRQEGSCDAPWSWGSRAGDFSACGLLKIPTKQDEKQCADAYGGTEQSTYASLDSWRPKAPPPSTDISWIQGQGLGTRLGGRVYWCAVFRAGGAQQQQ